MPAPVLRQASVREAIAKRPSQFVEATKTGTAASEEMLDAVVKHFGL